MKKKTKNLILLLSLIVICVVIGEIMAKYRSQAIATKELEIAYYVFESEQQVKQLKLNAMVPRNEPYRYGIMVSNSKDGRVSETAMEYTIEIRTTTNLPLQFAIKEEGQNENKITKTQIIQNEDGMYYIIMNTDIQEFGLKKENRNYILEITFPIEYKTNSEYADIIELVEVTVDSKQKI